MNKFTITKHKFYIIVTICLSSFISICAHEHFIYSYTQNNVCINIPDIINCNAHNTHVQKSLESTKKAFSNLKRDKKTKDTVEYSPIVITITSLYILFIFIQYFSDSKNTAVLDIHTYIKGKFITYPKKHNSNNHYIIYDKTKAESQELLNQALQELSDFFSAKTNTAKLNQYKNTELYKQEEMKANIEESLSVLLEEYLQNYKNHNYINLPNNLTVLKAYITTIQNYSKEVIQNLEQYCKMQNAGKVSSKSTIIVLLMYMKQEVDYLRHQLIQNYKNAIDLENLDKDQDNTHLIDVIHCLELLIESRIKSIAQFMIDIEPNACYYIELSLDNNLKYIDKVTQKDKYIILSNLSKILKTMFEEISINKMNDACFK